MRSVEVEIVNPTGLHTRPGNAFVKKAKEYSSAVTVVKGDRRANAKSLLSLMKVACTKGDRIVIEAEGPDEAAACDELAAFIATLED